MTAFRDFIQQVKDQADIVDIIREYVPLKKSGSRYLGICPFHHDRTPSLNVTPQMGIYKCFACGAGGDVLRFVQEYEKIDFVEALKLVAGRCGIPVPEDLGRGNRSDSDKTGLVLKANSLAADHYRKQLEANPEVRRYLEERGISDDTARHFQLGYAPENAEGLLRRAQRNGMDAKALVEAGIFGESGDGRLYDRFRGRLVFPVWNMSGHIIAFGARALRPEAQPKYLNSAESALYHKSRVLYGVHHARKQIDATGTVVLVEGYMDLLGLWQAGIRNAVAVSGTALTAEHVRVLARFARKALLFFDGDEAGQKAVRRSLAPLLSAGLEVRVPALPPDHDPDSFVRAQGEEGALRLFREAPGLVDFLARPLERGGMSPEAKNELLEDCLELIGRIPAPLVRSEYLTQLGKKFGLRALPLKVRIPRADARIRPGARAVAPASQAGPRAPEWQLLRLLLSSEELCFRATGDLDLDWVADSQAQNLIDHLLAHVEGEGRLDLKVLLEGLTETEQSQLARIDMGEDTANDEAYLLLEREYLDILRALEVRHIQKRRREEKDLARQLELQKRLREIMQTRGRPRP